MPETRGAPKFAAPASPAAARRPHDRPNATLSLPIRPETGSRVDLDPDLAADDRQRDLGRALGDRHEAGVTPEALDGELRDVAVAAEDLDRLPGHALRDLRGEQLRHRGLAHAVPLIEQPGGAPHHGARRLDLHRHTRQLELDRLELRDR